MRLKPHKAVGGLILLSNHWVIIIIIVQNPTTIAPPWLSCFRATTVPKQEEAQCSAHKRQTSYQNSSKNHPTICINPMHPSRWYSPKNSNTPLEDRC